MDIQGAGQIIFSGLGIAQYFCIVDFMKELPLLLYIRILYLHNPNTCGLRINIGQAIDGMANQAFVLVTREPEPVFRTFIITCIYLGLGLIWIFLGIFVLRGGVNNFQSKNLRWPWVVVTVIICALDIVATVTFANDSFRTKTLSDMMDFIGGIASGTGSLDLDTSMAAWTMALLSSRAVLVFMLNIVLIILVIVDCSKQRKLEDTHVLVESPTPGSLGDFTEIIERDIESAKHVADDTKIPRPGLSQSFRRMKTILFNKLTQGPRWSSASDSLDTPSERSRKGQHVDKKRTVNFPDNLLSLPQRLENLIAEQQRRLDNAVIDTTGRRSPPRTSQSMPQLDTASNQQDQVLGRRGTAAELQGQLPWAYIPASAHRMRDQLPPDEDLPPVPLPDYTAMQSQRKASVHRAASNLSSLPHKKDMIAQSQRNLPTLTQSDVLY